jgi:glycosyltransferase involved in cell wall biosynthesis
MRVLMSVDAVGGVWTYALELRAALAELGVEVTLAAIGPDAPTEPGVPYRRCLLEWQPEPWDDVRRSSEWLARLAREVEAEVVHLNGYSYAAATEWPAPTVVVGHSCVLSWHEAVRGMPAGAEWDRYRSEVAAGLRAAAAVAAPTRWMLARLRELYGLAGGSAILNGLAPPRAGAAAAKDSVILAAGRWWDPAKGHDLLACVAPELEWPVEIAGGQLERERLRRRMGRAAIFAHPARYEPFGLAPLEAAQAGCALVLGDIPSLRELWDGAAVFAAPQGLAPVLELLIADPALRERLAQRARARARRYTAQAMADEYAALYARLARREQVAA